MDGKRNNYVLTLWWIVLSAGFLTGCASHNSRFDNYLLNKSTDECDSYAFDSNGGFKQNFSSSLNHGPQPSKSRHQYGPPEGNAVTTTPSPPQPTCKPPSKRPA